MRHLITGGSGLIGNLVARRLRTRGDQVRVLDLWSDPERPADIEFIQGSILDAGTVASAMRDVDVVHHGAALVAQTGAGDAFRAVNVEGSRIVADAAVAAQARAVVHISSTSVYGLPPDGPITSATPEQPFESYGRSKLEGERIMHAVCARAAIPLITIRPRVTLCAGRLGIFELLFQWIARNRRVWMLGDGSNRMQFIHADDLIDFYMLALETRRTGIFNVGTDRFGTLRSDLEALIAHARSRSRLSSVPSAAAGTLLSAAYHLGLSPIVPWHYRTYHRPCHFDVAPLLAMGWQPVYSNAEMLCESYDWFYQQAGLPDPAQQSPHRSRLKRGLLRLTA